MVGTYIVFLCSRLKYPSQVVPQVPEPLGPPAVSYPVDTWPLQPKGKRLSTSRNTHTMQKRSPDIPYKWWPGEADG